MRPETDQIPNPAPVFIFGCGYVGTEVVRLARSEGRSVVALTRNAETAARLRTQGVHVVLGDLASSTWHAELDPRGAMAINCVSAGGGGVAGYERSYRQGMQSLLQWAGQRGPLARLLYTSSTSVYAQDGDVSVDETCPAEPTTETGQILRATERLLEAHVGTATRKGVVLRLAGIYGPDRHHLLDQLRTGSGVVAGKPDLWLNLIHRDDAASALWRLATDPVDQGFHLYNVSDNAPARRAEVVGWLAERLGLPRPSFTGEAVAGRRQLTPQRRIVAERLQDETGWRPQFQDYRAGYTALLGA